MLNNQIVIRVENLAKCYHIYDKPRDRLKQILSKKKKYYREFWALKNINFEIKKGEAFAIIGRNGSGKSTLLQLLSKTLTPTSGKIEVNGKIAALLELGSGFNPEFTGRENVYLNGAILGFSHHEMNLLMDDILTFADIGDFIDQPVKTYSSGMFVRLAFAVQSCVSPDILIVDEALSVGDVFFQQKCAKRMQQLRERGTTLIFVSHDMSIVRDLCAHAIYLKSGKLIYSGSSADAIRKYHLETQSVSFDSKEHSPMDHSDVSKLSKKEIHAQFKETACWIANTNEKNLNQAAKIIAISVLDNDNNPTLKTQMKCDLKFRILYQSFTDNPVHVGIILRNRYDHIIHSSGSYTNNITPPKLKSGEYGIFELQVKCMLESGQYTFSAVIGLGDLPGLLPNRGSMIDESPTLGPIVISWDYEKNNAPWFGMFGLPVEGRFFSATESNF